MANTSETKTEATRGLTQDPVPALRYDHRNPSPYEATGLIISLIKPKSRVLDVGCGVGWITQTIAIERESDVLGIEPNALRSASARELGLNVITGVYSAEIVQKYGKFDYVVFADVLEHLEDPFVVISSVADALNENGRVIASVPNVAHWTVRLRLLFGKFDYKPTGIMDATHLRWFTKKSIVRLFQEAGYEVDQMRHSTGSWLWEYQMTPLRLLPTKYKNRVISFLGDISHGLFALQHVFSARRR